MLAGQRLIVCSNDWFELLAPCSPSEQEWLNSNSIVVHVDKPLWIPDEVVGAGSGPTDDATPFETGPDSIQSAVQSNKDVASETLAEPCLPVSQI